MSDAFAGVEELGKIFVGCGCFLFAACALAGALAGLAIAGISLR